MKQPSTSTRAEAGPPKARGPVPYLEPVYNPKKHPALVPPARSVMERTRMRLVQTLLLNPTLDSATAAAALLTPPAAIAAAAPRRAASSLGATAPTLTKPAASVDARAKASGGGRRTLTPLDTAPRSQTPAGTRVVNDASSAGALLAVPAAMHTSLLWTAAAASRARADEGAARANTASDSILELTCHSEGAGGVAAFERSVARIQARTAGHRAVCGECADAATKHFSSAAAYISATCMRGREELERAEAAGRRDLYAAYAPAHKTQLAAAALRRRRLKAEERAAETQRALARGAAEEFVRRAAIAAEATLGPRVALYCLARRVLTSIARETAAVREQVLRHEAAQRRIAEATGLERMSRLNQAEAGLLRAPQDEPYARHSLEAEWWRVLQHMEARCREEAERARNAAAARVEKERSEQNARHEREETRARERLAVEENQARNTARAAAAAALSDLQAAALVAALADLEVMEAESRETRAAALQRDHVAMLARSLPAQEAAMRLQQRDRAWAAMERLGQEWARWLHAGIVPEPPPPPPPQTGACHRHNSTSGALNALRTARGKRHASTVLSRGPTEHHTATHPGGLFANSLARMPAHGDDAAFGMSLAGASMFGATISSVPRGGRAAALGLSTAAPPDGHLAPFAGAASTTAPPAHEAFVLPGGAGVNGVADTALATASRAAAPPLTLLATSTIVTGDEDEDADVALASQGGGAFGGVFASTMISGAFTDSAAFGRVLSSARGGAADPGVSARRGPRRNSRPDPPSEMMPHFVSPQAAAYALKLQQLQLVLREHALTCLVCNAPPSTPEIAALKDHAHRVAARETVDTLIDHVLAEMAAAIAPPPPRSPPAFFITQAGDADNEDDERVTHLQTAQHSQAQVLGVPNATRKGLEAHDAEALAAARDFLEEVWNQIFY